MKLTIEKYDEFGRGLSHNLGKVCFVNKALMGEEVEAQTIKSSKKYDLCKTMKVWKKSILRKASFCPYSNNCGGCLFDICSYLDSLKIKEEVLKSEFERNNIPCEKLVIKVNPHPLYYRNKVSLKVVNGLIGYYEEETHNFCEIKSCLIASKAINKAIKSFKYYHFLNGEVTIWSNTHDEVLLIIKTKEKVTIDDDLFVNNKVAGIIVNDNLVCNKPFIKERIGNALYNINYDAFFQVNPFVCEILANDLLEFINSEDKVLDLYCGVGYLSIKVAKKALEVVGVEVNEKAILNALENRKINYALNTSFQAGKTSAIVNKLDNDFTKVIVDPPRSGLDKITINYLLDKEFPTIIYVSCNSKTLIRDIKKLEEKYVVSSIMGYDMFSFTKHCESITVLEKRN